MARAPVSSFEVGNGYHLHARVVPAKQDERWKQFSIHLPLSVVLERKCDFPYSIPISIQRLHIVEWTEELHPFSMVQFLWYGPKYAQVAHVGEPGRELAKQPY